MALATYNVINDSSHICENNVWWDGVASWSPPAGSSAVAQKAAYAVGTGAVAVTNGSKNVTITGALLQTSGVEVGRRITFSGTGDSATTYTIASITGETTLTLNVNYDGTTVTDADYSISPVDIGDVIP